MESEEFTTVCGRAHCHCASSESHAHTCRSSPISVHHTDEGYQSCTILQTAHWSAICKNSRSSRRSSLHTKTLRRIPSAILVLHLVLLALSMYMPIVMAQETCRISPIRQTVYYRGCRSSRPVNMCRGTCYSYVQPLPRSPLNLQTTCSCCKATSTRDLTVQLQCPRTNGEVNRIHIQISMPRSCECRPCSDTP